MGKKRWNIEEYAFIGLFSFSQFVMWNDLRNRSEEISQNKGGVQPYGWLSHLCPPRI